MYCLSCLYCYLQATTWPWQRRTTTCTGSCPSSSLLAGARCPSCTIFCRRLHPGILHSCSSSCCSSCCCTSGSSCCLSYYSTSLYLLQLLCIYYLTAITTTLLLLIPLLYYYYYHYCYYIDMTSIWLFARQKTVSCTSRSTSTRLAASTWWASPPSSRYSRSLGAS